MSASTQPTIHDVRFPNESAEYRAARDSLLEAEMALRRQAEAVAAQRRALPQGGRVPEDYVFEEGDDARPVRLSELFGDKSVLLLYSFMYGPAMERACPSCTSILDGLDGEAPHIHERAAIAAVARSPIGRFRAFARERGWRRLRLLSSANNSYNQDYHGENAQGAQLPTPEHIHPWAGRRGAARLRNRTGLRPQGAGPGSSSRRFHLAALGCSRSFAGRPRRGFPPEAQLRIGPVPEGRW